MSKNISRRTFLKCAGAVTVAAGAASMLGGCTLFDGIADQMAGESEDGMRVGGALVRVRTVSGHKVAVQAPQSADAAVPAAKVDALSVEAKYATIVDNINVSATLKVEGQTAACLTGEEAKAYFTGALGDGEVMLKNPVSLDGAMQETKGWLVFKLPEDVAGTWTKAELTFTESVRGESGTYHITRDEAGNITCKK